MKYTCFPLIIGLASSILADPVFSTENLPSYSTSKSSSDNVATAYQAWRKGDIDAATSVTQSLSKHATFEEHLLQARLFNARGEYESSKQSYMLALEMASDDTQLALIHSELLPVDGIGASQDWINHLSEQQQKRVSVALAIKGDLNNAIRLFPKPSSYQEKIRLADWLLNDSQPEKAAALAWNAYKIAKNDTEQHYALALWAESARQLGNINQALKNLAAEPESALLAQTHLNLLLSLGDLTRARAYIAQSPFDEVKKQMQIVLNMQGDVAGLRDIYHAQLITDPGDLNALKSLAVSYLSEGDANRVEKLYRQFFQQFGKDFSLLQSAAESLQKLGLGQLALNLLESTKVDDADLINKRMALIDVKLGQGQVENALKDLQVLTEELDVADSRNLLIIDAYERASMPSLAMQVLRRLVEAHPDIGYDQRLHLARLAASTGETAEALGYYMTLWGTSTLPARRAFLENQIVRLAQKSNRIDSLVHDLSVDFEQGEGSQAKIDLLIALHMVTNDTHRAEETLQKRSAQIGLTPVQLLKQEIKLYSRTQDKKKLLTAYEDLARLDPEHAEQHLRNYAIVTLTNMQVSTLSEREQQADALIHKLSNAMNGQGAPIDSDFAAGIYTMANLPDKAIQAYRIKLRENPEETDNWLLLTDLMMKSGQLFETMYMLEAVALQATSNKEFSIAIDGLLNVYGGAFNQIGKQTSRIKELTGMLDWAQRQLLSRYILTGDNGLMALMGDVAELREDKQIQARILQNSLPHAEEQIAFVLRQLVTLYSGGAVASAQATADTDNAEKLRYGLRLLSLQKEYPPDFYADLAKSLLQQGDEAGAEQAFAMINDTSGLTNVSEIKARTYDQQGYADQARINFTEALLYDNHNLSLALHTGILLEQAEDDNQAQQVYLDAIVKLLHQLPLLGKDLYSATGLDYQRYYAGLSEGLVITWPQDKEISLAQFKAMLKGLTDSVDQTLHALARNNAGKPVLVQSFVFSEMLLRIAQHQQRYDWIDEVSKAINPLMSDSPDIARLIATAKVRIPEVFTEESTEHKKWVYSQLKDRSNLTDNKLLQLAVAIAENNFSILDELVDEAIEDEVRRQQQFGFQASDSIRKSLLYRVISISLNQLSDENFHTLVLRKILGMPGAERMYFDMLRAWPDLYSQLESRTGTALLSEAAIETILLENHHDSLVFSQDSKNNLSAYLNNHFVTEKLVALFEKTISARTGNAEENRLQVMLIDRILHSNLLPEVQERFIEVFEKQISSANNSGNSNIEFYVRLLLITDLPQINQSLLFTLAERVAQRYDAAVKLPVFLKNFYRGEFDKAYDCLTQLYSDTSAVARGIDYTRNIIDEYLADAEKRYIAQFMAKTSPSEELIAEFYQRFALGQRFATEKAELARVIQHYEKLVELRPQNEIYIFGLLDLLVRAERFSSAIGYLQSYVETHDYPEKETALLFYMLINTKQTDAAEALQNRVLKNNGPVLDDIEFFTQLYQQAVNDRYGNYEPNVFSVLRSQAEVFLLTQQHNPEWQALLKGAQVIVQGRGRENLRRLQTVVKSYFAKDNQWTTELRGLWRFSLASGKELSRNSMLNTHYLLTEQDVLLMEHQNFWQKVNANENLFSLTDILSSGEGMSELERFLQALPEEQRADQQGLYMVLAEGIVSRGGAAEKIDLLEKKLVLSALSNHEMQLLLALAKRENVVLTNSARKNMLAILQQQPLVNENVAASALFQVTKAHDYRAAEQLVEWLSWVLLTKSEQWRLVLLENKGELSLRDLVENLAQWRDLAIRDRVFMTLMKRTQMTLEYAGAAENIQAFVKRMALLLPENEKVLSEISSFFTPLKSDNLDADLADISLLLANHKMDLASKRFLNWLDTLEGTEVFDAGQFNNLLPLYSQLYGSENTQGLEGESGLQTLLKITGDERWWSAPEWQQFVEKSVRERFSGRDGE